MYNKWLSRRRSTFIILTMEAFFMGCEYAITILNLWVYVKSMMKNVNQVLLYSILAVIWFSSTALSSVVIGRITDKTRQVRLILFLSNILFIVGNILYIIPFSYCHLLIGRVLAGSGQGIRSLITGEITRCYDNDDVAKMFATIGAAQAMGITVSPVINLLVHSVNFKIGKLQLTFANTPSLIMAVAFLLIQLSAFCLVHDLSQGNDEKQETFQGYEFESKTLLDNPDSSIDLNQANENVKLDGVRKTFDESYSIVWLFRALVSNCDTLLLLTLQFIETIFFFSLWLQDPLIFMQILKWTVLSYNWLMFISSILLIVPCVLLTLLKVSNKKIFLLAISGIFGYCFLEILAIIWAKKLLSSTGNIILCVFYCIFWGPAVFLREVFITGYLSRMVAPCYKSTTDGIRLGISNVTAIIAVLSASYALLVIDRVGTVLIIIQSIVGLLVIARYKTIMNPKIIIK